MDTETIRLPSGSLGSAGSELIVHRFGEIGCGKKVYAQAALHADEWPGMMAIHHLLPQLQQAERDGRIQGEIVLVPVCNPLGLRQRIGGHLSGRYAFDGSGNYNRNWADLLDLSLALIRGKLSSDVERDVAFIKQILRGVIADTRPHSEINHLRKQLMTLACDADYVLDLHCDSDAEMHLYSNARHEAIATDLAKSIGSPLLLLESTAGGGPFDEACASVWWQLKEQLAEASHLPNACFSATVEYRGTSDISDQNGRYDATGLMSFLESIGVVQGEPSYRDVELTTVGLDAVDVVHTECAGLVSYCVELGEQVEEGQLIGHVIDPREADFEKARAPFYSKTSGRLFTRRVDRMVTAGSGVAKIAGSEALAHRREGALLEV